MSEHVDEPDLEDLEERGEDLPAGGEHDETTAPGDAPEPITAAEVAAFVEELLPVIESWSDTDQAWCASWWDHPEAVQRLTALYEAYMVAIANQEHSSWWVNHWDRHAPALLGQRGIFQHCRQNGHNPERRMPFAKLDPPPADWTL